MGSVLVKPGKHFICGGVTQFKTKATRSTYLYYSQTNNCVEQAKMFDSRYCFAVCLINEWVYVFGGRRSEEEVLTSCEK